MHIGEPQKAAEGERSSEVQIFSGNRISWDVREGLSRMIEMGDRDVSGRARVCHAGRAGDKAENQPCPQLWQRSN